MSIKWTCSEVPAHKAFPAMQSTGESITSGKQFLRRNLCSRLYKTIVSEILSVFPNQSTEKH